MFIEDLYETLKRRNKGLLIISSIRKAEFEKRRKLLMEDEFFVKKLFEYVENGEKIYLKGFDKDLLSELIEIATNIKDERIQIISEEIINYLSKEKEANTLFAIETFNLISDENFSQKYKTIKIFEKGKINKNINRENIREIFEKLKEAHKKSYAEIKGGFDLPSFAVLESRLELLKDEIDKTLGEGYGKFTKELLLFSALGDNPFKGNFIFEKLNQLKEFKKFQEELGKLPSLNDIPFEIMEEIYELIKRIDIEFFYDYKHFLLKTYLIVKLEKLIENYSEETKLQIYEILYESLEEIYDNYLEGRISEIEIKFYLTWSLRIDNYSKILINLGNAYKQKNDYKNAIYYIKNLLEAIEPYRGIQKFEIIYNDAIGIFNELKNSIN